MLYNAANNRRDKMKLEVHDLHKSFQGKEVLHGISFTIESGKALGLLGVTARGNQQPFAF